MIDEIRTCTKCGEAKEIKEFPRFAQGRGGYDARCKVCARARHAAWYKVNSERVRAKAAVWYAENHERARAVQAAWAADNVERKRSADAAYRAANADAQRVRKAAYYAEHREAWRDARDLRRARQRNAPISERVYRAKVWERDGGRCHICGRKADPNDWHLEHIVPLSRGGEHSYRNVAVAHPKCNLRKGVTGPAQARLLP